MPGPIQSIERAAAILRLLASAPGPLRLTEISSSISLPRGTAHGILRTLADVGFVDQDRVTGRYLLGAGLNGLARHHVDPNELRARSLNWADPLAARSGEAVRVAVPEGCDARVVHYVFRPDHSVQHGDVGAVLPGHANALGKVLLAFHPASAALLARSGLTWYTGRTITTRSGFVADLAQVRRQGYAVEMGEHLLDLAGIAVPLIGLGGLVAGAIGIHGPVDRLCDPSGVPRPRLVTLVLECARSISRELTTPRSHR